jgi:hypothetical protein
MRDTAVILAPPFGLDVNGTATFDIKLLLPGNSHLLANHWYYLVIFTQAQYVWMAVVGHGLQQAHK